MVSPGPMLLDDGMRVPRKFYHRRIDDSRKFHADRGFRPSAIDQTGTPARLCRKTPRRTRNPSKPREKPRRREQFLLICLPEKKSGKCAVEDGPPKGTS